MRLLTGCRNSKLTHVFLDSTTEPFISGLLNCHTEEQLLFRRARLPVIVSQNSLTLCPAFSKYKQPQGVLSVGGYHNQEIRCRSLVTPQPPLSMPPSTSISAPATPTATFATAGPRRLLSREPHDFAAAAAVHVGLHV
ncbi:hypothetical protein B0H12DRAFT_1228671 [Mycena haematopus]|nr:hypothetical protein B0H12DRAFT_1228671 [Mycena haematopus]